jgi:hypothetical protein
MQRHLSRALLIGSAIMLVLIASPTVDGGGGGPDAAVKKTFEKMIDALKANDRDAFVADATDQVKEALTPEAMEALHKNLGSRLKKGFTPTYLTQLKQAGHQVHLWKVGFKDDGDDVLIRLAIKDGKVGGFFAQ